MTQEIITKQRAEIIHTNYAKKLLEGKRITAVRYMNEEEMKYYCWNRKALMFALEDGTICILSQDDEGNGPGALLTTDKDIPIIPVI